MAVLRPALGELDDLELGDELGRFAWREEERPWRLVVALEVDHGGLQDDEPSPGGEGSRVGRKERALVETMTSQGPVGKGSVCRSTSSVVSDRPSASARSDRQGHR